LIAGQGVQMTPGYSLFGVKSEVRIGKSMDSLSLLLRQKILGG